MKKIKQNSGNILKWRRLWSITESSNLFSFFKLLCENSYFRLILSENGSSAKTGWEKLFTSTEESLLPESTDIWVQRTATMLHNSHRLALYLDRKIAEIFGFQKRNSGKLKLVIVMNN